jgi:hypothetical protein
VHRRTFFLQEIAHGLLSESCNLKRKSSGQPEITLPPIIYELAGRTDYRTSG